MPSNTQFVFLLNILWYQRCNQNDSKSNITTMLFITQVKYLIKCSWVKSPKQTVLGGVFWQRLSLDQPYNRTIHHGASKIHLVFFWILSENKTLNSSHITIMNAIRKWSGWLALSIPDIGYSADKQHRGNGSGRRNYFIVWRRCHHTIRHFVRTFTRNRHRCDSEKTQTLHLTS